LILMRSLCPHLSASFLFARALLATAARWPGHTGGRLTSGVCLISANCLLLHPIFTTPDLHRGASPEDLILDELNAAGKL